MNKFGEFETTVYLTTETKSLKNGLKDYSYGTITIRDRRLNALVGQSLVIKVFITTERSEAASGDQ